jgi:hypothetical protein
MMRFLAELGLPIPRSLRLAAEFVLNRELRRTLAVESVDLSRAETLLFEALALSVNLDAEGLSYAISQTLEALASDAVPVSETERLQQLADLAALAKSLPFKVDLWRVQNAFYRQVRDVYPGYRERAANGDAAAQSWTELFVVAGERLAVAVP